VKENLLNHLARSCHIAGALTMQLNMMPLLSPNFNLVIIVLGALYCLVPLLNIDDARRFTTEDISSYNDSVTTLFHGSPSILIPFFIVLIPAADLLLDIPSHISSYFYPDEKSSKKIKQSSVVVRLNEIERLLFMLGVGIQSTIWFISQSTSPATMGVLYFSTTNSSIMLVIGPIITYLQRCTTTFTSFRAFTIVILAAIGFTVLSTSGFYRSDMKKFESLTKSGTLIVAVAALMLASFTAICALKYCHQKSGFLFGSRNLPEWSLKLFRITVPADEKADSTVHSDSDLYTNYLPALHMFACFVFISANINVTLVKIGNPTINFEVRNYIVIAVEIIVLIIELRIRKNEVARGLVRNLRLT
jgi:hypothetical protein